MGFSLDITVPAITVFIQGLLSFLSPCILPLVPIYIGYLAGVKKEDAQGNIIYSYKTVLINTLFFVIGISFAFFLLGLGFTSLGQFFTQHQVLFTKIGGILIILLGVNQLGIFGKSGFTKDLRIPFNLSKIAVNPFVSLIMGFTFSFAWTPCVGPILASVLVMASSAKTATLGFILIGVYTLGFTLPFMLVGVFNTTILQLFKKHQNIIKYTVKIGAILMIAIGIMMYSGWMNGFSNYLNTTPKQQEETDAIEAIDFTLQDQYGNIHTLSDYKGKTVFLNFWATWCPPCKEEMPDIEKLYLNYGQNQEDIIILSVAFPDNDPLTDEGTSQEVIDFMHDNNYTYPALLNEDQTLAYQYNIRSFPTTYMIDKNGNIYGYLPGMMTYDIMVEIINQTLESVE